MPEENVDKMSDIKLPFDIIINVLKMRNMDSQMSSPTATIMKKTH